MIAKVILAGSVVAATLSGVPSANEDMLGWLLKAIFGVMLAIIAYFIKQIADQMKSNQKELAAQRQILKRHNIMFTYFVSEAKNNLAGREDGVGRRKSDASLIALLDALSNQLQVDDE